jgi:hypothetical protein
MKRALAVFFSFLALSAAAARVQVTLVRWPYT